MSLGTQGRLFQVVDTHASAVWSGAIQSINWTGNEVCAKHGL